MKIDEKAFMESWEKVWDGSDDCCLKHRMRRFLEAYLSAKQPEQTAGDVEAVGVAIAEELLLIPHGTPWEDKSDRLAKAAIAAMPAQPDTSSKRLAESMRIEGDN